MDERIFVSRIEGMNEYSSDNEMGSRIETRRLGNRDVSILSL
jgi:hypothetical protein